MFRKPIRLNLNTALILYLLFLLISCKTENSNGDFGEDYNLLTNHTEVIMLNTGESHVIVTPEYQGRVITSSSKGMTGRSYGWFNRDLVKSGLGPSNNVMGGEDRLWFGPEYGPYTIFFDAGDEMIGDNVDVPAPIDREPMEVESYTTTDITMKKTMSIVNYSGFTFSFDTERTISILNRDQVEDKLGVTTGTLDYVGFESKTKITNRSTTSWSKESGLLSIWDLGAFPPGEELTVIIPLSNQENEVTQYWTEAGEEYLKVKDNVVYYKANGDHIHKIGTPPSISKDVAGSYNPLTGVLTIIKFTLNQSGTYVNSQWVDAMDPYQGDVIMIFNDGIGEDGRGPFGPFYELESSSDVKELATGESQTHTHATFHFEGDRLRLNTICEALLNTSLENIEAAF